MNKYTIEGTKAQMIQWLDFIEEGANPHDIIEVTDRLEKIASYLASSPPYVAFAEKIMAKAQNKELIKILKHPIHRTLEINNKKILINGKCSDEIALVTYCQRANAALTHCLEAGRSQLTTLRMELDFEMRGGEINQ